MNPNLKTIFFCLMITCLSALVSANGVSPLESSPIYKIIMTQMELMTKEKTEKNGFAKIQALLNDLIDSAHIQHDFVQKRRKIEISRCQVEKHSLSLQIEDIETLKKSYIKRLNQLTKNTKLISLIKRLKFRLNRLRKQKYVYQKTYELVKEKYDLLVSLSKKIYPHIKCAQGNFEELVSNSYKNFHKKDNNKELLLRLIKSELNFCYKDFSKILRNQIAPLDDTANCSYKSKFLNSLALVNPKSDNYIAGVHNSRVIYNTLKAFNIYFEEKFGRYSNYSKKIFSFNLGIGSIEKLIFDFEQQHLKNYKLVKKGLRSQINFFSHAIENLQETQELVKKECKQKLVSLQMEEENLEKSIESYKDLKLYFSSNYSKISATMKKKYN